ncbi:hypothetical protein GCM10010452_50630 [Crossiella cryophila]
MLLPALGAIAVGVGFGWGYWLRAGGKAAVGLIAGRGVVAERSWGGAVVGWRGVAVVGWRRFSVGGLGCGAGDEGAICP